MHACDRSAASCTDEYTHFAPRNRHQRTAKASAGSSRFPTVWPNLRNILIWTLSPSTIPHVDRQCVHSVASVACETLLRTLPQGAPCRLSDSRWLLMTLVSFTTAVIHRPPAAQRRRVAAAHASSALRREVVQPQAPSVIAAGRRSDLLVGSDHTLSSCDSRRCFSTRHWHTAVMHPCWPSIGDVTRKVHSHYFIPWVGGDGSAAVLERVRTRQRLLRRAQVFVRHSATLMLTGNAATVATMLCAAAQLPVLPRLQGSRAEKMSAYRAWQQEIEGTPAGSRGAAAPAAQ